MITKQKKRFLQRLSYYRDLHNTYYAQNRYICKREERDRGRFNDKKKKVLSDQVQLFGGYRT